MFAAVASLVLTGIVVAAFINGPQRGVTALIFVRPLCDRVYELARFDVAGQDISYGAVMNFIVIGMMIVSLHRINNKVQVTLERSWVPFLVIALIAVLYSPVKADAFRKFLTYVSYLSMFVLPFALVKTERTAENFFKIIVLSSVMPVLYGFFQVLSGIDWYQGTRIESTFTHPNIFSFYLLTTIGTILFLSVTKRFHLSKRWQSALGLYLIPLLVLLVMTKTRSAWVGCLLMFLVYGTIRDKRILVVTLVLPVLALAIPAVRQRLTDLETGNHYVGWAQNVNAYAWRKILWGKSFSLIVKRPLFGYGLYSFPFYSPTFFPLEASRGVDAHNVYIQLLFETGLLGLGGYIWIFWRKFTWLMRYWRFDRAGLTVAATMMGVYLITCYSDNLLEYVSYGWLYWFTFGLIFADLSQFRPGARPIPTSDFHDLQPTEVFARVRSA